ncbi:MAG: TetR/AcrR family transcriptional regulator [Alphaproteobacteria bacterium]|nr:TetR/AcrR family transcriptional regulator [Alphaproteobacteria bacterium]
MAMTPEELKAATPSKRELIVAAARKLFLESGFGSTSMDAIAAQAGVSKRTVYSHFENKETLFAAIMGDMCRIISGANPDEPIPDENPEFVLRTVGMHIFLSVIKPEALDVFRVVLAENATFPELGKAFWKAGPEVMKDYLAGYLSELDRRGILSIPDANLAAFQFMGMIKWPYHNRLLFSAGGQPTKEELDAALDQAVSIFVGGLKPRGLSARV